MNEIAKADALIQQGVDEFRLAAAKTATGIIEQGIAVLKIKQGCEVKQGGTDFPDVVMRELGLPLSAAKKYALIGEAAQKLVPVGTSLPSDSISTIYHIARMDEATIADKIKRGVITPTATRDQVLEQMRVQKQKTVKAKDEPESLGVDVTEVFARLAKKDQKLLNDHMAAIQKEIKAKARKEAKEEIEEARKRKAQADETRRRLEQKLEVASSPFTKDEYRMILGMLHPDKHPGNEERAKKAFDIFKRIQDFCEDGPVLRSVK